jgi:hypothetical protein
MALLLRRRDRDPGIDVGRVKRRWRHR